MSTIGFVGSGNVGQALARAVIGRGHEAIMSNSRGPSTLSALTESLGQRARAGSTAEAVEQADIVVLAIPFTSIDQLPAAALKGKVVIDATNYWAPRDGHVAGIDSGETTSSEMIAERLPGARIVKAFNSIKAADIIQQAKPSGRDGRRAVPIAGDDPRSKQIVAALIDTVGFDVVDLGPLAAGRSIDPLDAWENALGARETETLLRTRLHGFHAEPESAQ
ncbi:MAG: 8-hydroxy-5-deazaflavin:NADPH oxidoreductase [Frankiales bacterium]|jgi:predicted dinucleotide-binding enzyme|nr:8-hydroxy-5-deazaflavin:NADPH oxidoreductase [Frankiales bacterium]